MRNAVNMKSSGGFTLIELAMVLFIIGLLLAPVLLFSPKLIDSWKADLTRIKAERIMAAYANFMQKNDRLPCVAWPQIDANSPILGAERNLAAVANWQKGCQNTQANGTAWANGHNVGIVPFRALGIPEDYIFDGWQRPFQVRADPKSALPIDNPNTWAEYNDDPSITYHEANAQIPSGCATADWWNMNYPDADRTIYDMDGKDNAGVASAWRGNTYSDPANDAANPNRRRLSHINMPKANLCCGANWKRDHIARYEGDINAYVTGWPWGQNMSWQRYELSTLSFEQVHGDSQHDDNSNIYDWEAMWVRNFATGTAGYTYQSGSNDLTALGWASWYQNNRVDLGNWGWGGQTTSFGPAQTDQPIYMTEPLAVTLISAGPNGSGLQVFDYDGSGQCASGNCDTAKPVQTSAGERANGIYYAVGGFNDWWSNNLGITVIRHPFESNLVPGENVIFDDLVYYARTDTLMAAAGRGTCSRP